VQDSVRIGPEVNVVCDHNHSDAMFPVQVDQDAHNHVRALGVEIPPMHAKINTHLARVNEY